MTYKISDFLYDRRIYDQVRLLIEAGRTNYSDLIKTEKDDIIIRIIEVLGTDSYNLIIGHDDFDKVLDYFSKFLQTANREYAADLVNQMRTNAHEQYACQLDNLFAEIMEQEDIEIKKDLGLTPIQYKQDGEIRWVLT